MNASISPSGRTLPLPKSDFQGARPRDEEHVWIRPHYASFNGLRAVAVFLVFLMHFGAYSLPERLTRNMWVGVDLFFVLSGFLITGILYDSLDDPRYFRNFYVRRALRIFPIFYGFFLLLFLLTPILHVRFERGLLAYVFYFGNLTLPFADTPHHNPTILLFQVGSHHPTLNIGHLWSLCVEEQFYLLWPAIVYLVRSRTRLMRVCIFGSVTVVLLRIVIEFVASPRVLQQWLVADATYCRADTLLVGAYLALWLRGRAVSPRELRKLSLRLIVIPAAVLLTFAIPLHGAKWRFFLETAGFSLIALVAAGFLLRALDDSSRVSRLLQVRCLSAFGAISYGFYFIHHLFMYEVRSLFDHSTLVRRWSMLLPFAAFAISFFLAKLSFRYFESPFLRMKGKIAPPWEVSAPVSRNATGRQVAPVSSLPFSEPQPAA